MKPNSLHTAEKKPKQRIIRYFASEHPGVAPGVSTNVQAERILYAAAGALLLALMLFGFQQFYLHGRAFPAQPIFPGLKGLLIAHASVMTAWMTLFVVQTILVVNHSWRTHMSLGMAGIGLAAAVIVLGTWTALAASRIEPDIIRGGLNRRQFMIVPLSDMLKFAALVTLAIWNRQRPEIHRPMMLLATLTMISAATGRIPAVQDLYVSTIWAQWFGPFFPKLVIGVAFLLVKTLITRRWDGWLAGGLGVLTVLSWMVWQIAPTAGWQRMADFLTD